MSLLLLIKIFFVYLLLAGWRYHVLSQLMSVFTVTQHCMPQEGIVEPSDNMTLMGCALLCSEITSCAGFGFQEKNQFCRAGSYVTDNVIDSTHCIAGETIYTSVAAQILECDVEDGWYLNPVRNTCIKVFNSLVIRDEAQTSCEQHGSSLAVWDTDKSKDVFRNLVENNISGWNGNGEAVWTGARWMEISGRWEWSTGEEVADEVWAPYQPDGTGLCPHLYRVRDDADFSFKMDDIPCSYVRQYVCEK